MASDNVFSLAEEMGWWDPESGEEFRFAYAYANRNSLYSRRREWRALSLLAPSLGLDPNSENYPLSVKPDEKVTVQDLLTIFRDYYADTPFDMTRRLTVVNRDGETVKSPVANPFMNSDLRALLEMPDSYMVDGRREFSRDCAWWAFRRASKLSYFRYEQMKGVLQEVWEPIEEEAFARQASLEEEALALYRRDPALAEAFLTEYTWGLADRTVERYWQLGDQLWVRFNNQF
jgi:dipeptidase